MVIIPSFSTNHGGAPKNLRVLTEPLANEYYLPRETKSLFKSHSETMITRSRIRTQQIPILLSSKIIMEKLYPHQECP